MDTEWIRKGMDWCISASMKDDRLRGKVQESILLRKKYTFEKNISQSLFFVLSFLLEVNNILETKKIIFNHAKIFIDDCEKYLKSFECGTGDEYWQQVGWTFCVRQVRTPFALCTRDATDKSLLKRINQFAVDKNVKLYNTRLIIDNNIAILLSLRLQRKKSKECVKGNEEERYWDDWDDFRGF